MIYIVILALIGLALSLYAHHLEQQLKTDEQFRAACDINDRISCTRPLLSSYANFFYYSNSFLGIVFYSTLAVIAFCNLHTLVLLMAVAAMIATLILAYLLYFEIKSICLVCTSLYMVNILILLCALWCK
jgi:vitamin-K-epoxide reductase (warfarin-sensitive)